MTGSLQRIIWLASYPKSGNTWIRSFLANYFLGRRREIDINSLREFTLSDIRIDFYQRAVGGGYKAESFEDCLKVRPKALRLIAAEREGTHFVKTHHRLDRIGNQPLIPPELTAAAVYILRNPFDVAPSFARHSGLSLDDAIAGMTNPEMMTASPAGVYEWLGRWDDHIASWTGAPGLPIVTVRYEDLLTDPRKGFLPIFEFLKTPVNTAHLKKTIRATSFDSLRKQEEEKGFIERPATMERFFHSGKSGGWRESLTPAQVARLHTAFEPALRRWYPELVEETAAITEEQGA